MKKDLKDILMLSSAGVTLMSGIVMAFLSFFLSAEHAIHDSVLWYFAQCLIYAGSAFGIAAYVNIKLNDIGHITYDKINQAFHARGNDPQRSRHKE